jgi:apolipoprotein N-acyltransferase
MILQSLAVRALLCLLAGSLFTLGLAPFDLKLLSLASMATFVIALWGRSWRQSLLLGWCYGIGFFGAGVSWVYVSINVYGDAPLALALALTTVFCAGLALLFGIQAALFSLLRPTQTGLRILLFSSLWVVFEWLRTWLLTGFPWLFVGYTALDTVLAGWAPLIGVLGVSLLIAVTAAGIAELIIDWSVPRGFRLATWLVLLSGTGYLLDSVQWTQPGNEARKVAIYQPNIALEATWDRNNAPILLNDFLDHANVHTASSDLVVWPEGALPFFFDQASGYVTKLSDIANRSNATIVTGMPTREGARRFNSIVALGPIPQTYNKQKLVPFGEFVPLEATLRGTIDFFDLPMSNFTEGDAEQAPLSSSIGSLAPFICYEIVYPDFVAKGSRSSNLLITISNDAWFGASHGPHQHFQMARYRALELQKQLIRGANNGITAIIDEKGDIVGELPQFERATLTGEVVAREGLTPFARFGSSPILLISLIFPLFIGIKARRQRG